MGMSSISPVTTMDHTVARSLLSTLLGLPRWALLLLPEHRPLSYPCLRFRVLLLVVDV